jgi:hypothetical protein
MENSFYILVIDREVTILKRELRNLFQMVLSCQKKFEIIKDI